MTRVIKIIFLLMGSLLCSDLCAQDGRHLYQDTLSKAEKNILNEVFEEFRGEKDFAQMKIAFFSSPGGTVQRFHEDFFESLDKHVSNPAYPLGNLLFFNEKEKEKHGYDVAIVYESKNVQPRLNKKLKRIKKSYLKQTKTYTGK